METIKGQCPCGQALTAVIFDDGELRFYVKLGRQRYRRIQHCPCCEKDFSKITAEELKENAWTM